MISLAVATLAIFAHSTPVYHPVSYHSPILCSVKQGPRVNTVVLIGDSFFDEEGIPGPAYIQMSEVMRRRMDGLGYNASTLNAARSGAKTGGGQAKAMTNLVAAIWQPYTSSPFSTTNCPVLGIINGSINDVLTVTASACTWSANVFTVPATSNAFAVGDWFHFNNFDQSSLDAWLQVVTDNGSQLTFTVAGSGAPSSSGNNAFGTLDTETYLRSLMRAGEFGANLIVASQSSLPVNGVDGDRAVVSYDTSSNGGAAFPASAFTPLPQITGAISNNTLGASEPTVWQCVSGQNGALSGGGVASWARVARASTSPTHIKNWLISNCYYMNWASGGDTQSTQMYQYSSLVPGGLRYLQNHAVSDEIAAGNTSVALVDSFTYTSNLVASGKSTQGDAFFHITTGNPHRSGAGDSWWADCFIQAIQANPALVATLKIGGQVGAGDGLRF